jgi:hypothetical protein
MASASTHLLAKSEAAIEWYWKFGCQRNDPKYEVSRGSWLDPLYRSREQARAILRAEALAKPCMALWGPSQSGKSTLLSKYLDTDDDPRGERSALSWSEPVRFVVGSDKSEDVIVLNPFNFASDASGCVSRFVLREQVPDPAHPVEIEFAAEAQIMHALAVGYLSECEPRNEKGETTAWTVDAFKALLDKQKTSGPPQRAAFEKLQQLAETLDLLILSELPRYLNLREEWKRSLRSQLLQTPALLGSMESVEIFAYDLLWDAWSSLTRTYKNLVAKRRQIAQEWGDDPVRCSFYVAAILLDIDSYKKCAERPATRRKVESLTVIRDGDGAVCASGPPGSSPLVRGADDFGLLQALVWELRIPVRGDVLRQRAPVLAEFLEAADLLDFPGVANNPGNAKRHSNEAVMESPQIALTEVLKRGKTASIVVTSARNLDIDGFSILVRVDRFPGQPKQLVSGIESWMQSFGKSLNTCGKTMPLNLVITFCGVLVNQVRSAGTRDGLQPVFDRLKSLAYLSDPKIVSTFSTNYPQFDEGRINGAPAEQAAAVEAIIGDPSFKERFGGGADSFREMFANGGSDYVFRQLTAQAAKSRRPEFVAARLAEIAAHTQQLILQHMPGENTAADERNRALARWSEAMQARLREPSAPETGIDGPTRLSRHLRAFLNIDAEEFDDVPQSAINRNVNVRGFIEKQFRSWQVKRADYPDLPALGLDDSTQAARILAYLIEAADAASVERFFRDWLGHIEKRLDGRHARRFLAVQMSNALLNRPAIAPTHRPMPNGHHVETVREVLEAFANVEENHQDAPPEQSPHYLTVIYPFLKRLEEIRTRPVGSRVRQVGDDKLVAISKLP